MHRGSSHLRFRKVVLVDADESATMHIGEGMLLYEVVCVDPSRHTGQERVVPQSAICSKKKEKTQDIGNNLLLGYFVQTRTDPVEPGWSVAVVRNCRRTEDGQGFEIGCRETVLHDP